MALPSMPYDVRPAELPLDIEECRTAIWRAAGNVTQAAELLKVSSLRLRAFIRKSPYLSAEVAEAQEQIKDLAEGIVVDALMDTEDKARQDAMAKFVLLGPGKDRGYGAGAPKVTINNQKGASMTIAWADGTSIGPQAPVIDHE